VYGAFGIFEGLFAFIVNMIPYYNVFKLAAFIWLYHPSALGASKVCEHRDNIAGTNGQPRSVWGDMKFCLLYLIISFSSSAIARSGVRCRAGEVREAPCCQGGHEGGLKKWSKRLLGHRRACGRRMFGDVLQVWLCRSEPWHDRHSARGLLFVYCACPCRCGTPCFFF